MRWGRGGEKVRGLKSRRGRGCGWSDWVSEYQQDSFVSEKDEVWWRGREGEGEREKKDGMDGRGVFCDATRRRNKKERRDGQRYACG